ncbi:MAG TPA: hypothetical protein VMZ53_32650 [Kofleriaceae bacterium]|nr:hypothetical protein [Kofleriaceae bacterium]
MRRCLVLLGLCGCDALFGIDTLDYKPDAPVDTAPRITVTGHAVKRWLHNNAAHEPTLEPAIHPAMPIAVHLADGSVPPTTWDPATSEFSFEAGVGERYAVTYATNLGSYEYQMTTPTLTLQDVELGHPDQVAPGAQAVVQWLPTSGTTLAAADVRFASTGVWTNTVPTSPATNNFIVNWPSAVVVGGQRPALLSAAAHDSLYFLHYTTVATTPPHRVVDQYAEVTDAAQDANTTTTYINALQPLPRTDCVDLHVRRAAEFARLSQYPKFATPGGTTQILADAMPELGFRAPHELALITSTTDTNVAVSYTNPFPGFGTMIAENNYLSRQITGGGTISVNTQYIDLITPTSPCMRYDDPPPPPFVMTPSLAGVPLADDIVIGIDASKLVELTWSWDSEPAAVTQVNLMKGASELVRVFFSTDGKILIDPALLDANTAYRLVLAPYHGYFPNVAEGDFATRTYPARLSILMTGYFKVAK